MGRAVEPATVFRRAHWQRAAGCWELLLNFQRQGPESLCGNSILQVPERANNPKGVTRYSPALPALGIVETNRSPVRDDAITFKFSHRLQGPAFWNASENDDIRFLKNPRSDITYDGRRYWWLHKKCPSFQMPGLKAQGHFNLIPGLKAGAPTLRQAAQADIINAALNSLSPFARKRPAADRRRPAPPAPAGRGARRGSTQIFSCSCSRAISLELLFKSVILNRRRRIPASARGLGLIWCS